MRRRLSLESQVTNQQRHDVAGIMALPKESFDPRPLNSFGAIRSHSRLALAVMESVSRRVGIATGSQLIARIGFAKMLPGRIHHPTRAARAGTPVRSQY